MSCSHRLLTMMVTMILVKCSFGREKQPQSTIQRVRLGGGRSRGRVGMECDERGRRKVEGRAVVLQTRLSLIAQVVITRGENSVNGHSQQQTSTG